MIRQTFHGAWFVVRRSLVIIRSDLHILIYPYLAIVFILLTSPVVGRFVIGNWDKLQTPEVFDQVTATAPNQFLGHVGLVTFSVFYAILVSSFFTCMVAVHTLAELEKRPPTMFYGLRVVIKRFSRVFIFSLLAIFFLPMGIAAQWKKFRSPKGAFEAITSSFSLSMPQLAPAVVTGKEGVFATVRHSMDTLGQLWKESLVIRIGLFVTVLILGFISFLPKLIEHYWFDSSSSHFIGWVATALLGASSYVLIRVIGTVFTTTLYHEAKSKK